MRTICLLACLFLSLVIPGGFAAVGAQTPAAGLNWAPCPAGRCRRGHAGRCG